MPMLRKLITPPMSRDHHPIHPSLKDTSTHNDTVAGTNSSSTACFDITDAAKLYGEYLQAEGRHTDNKKIIFNLLNEIALSERILLDGPLMVGIDVLSECNLHCSHCFRDEEVLPRGRRLSTGHILSLIDTLDDAGVLETYLTGGEPFIRKDIIQILAHIKSYNMMTNIHTNGTLITASLCKAMEPMLDPSMDFIQVSIDGGTQETHDRIRGRGSFVRALQGIHRLIDRNIPVRINMVVNAANYQEMRLLYQLCHQLGVPEISFSPLLRTRFNSRLALPDDDTLLLEFSRVVALHRSLDNRPRITQDPIAVPCGHTAVATVLKNLFPAVRYVCPAGSIAAEIDPKGEVYPCPYLHYPEFSGGNIHDRPLATIWKDHDNWKSLRGFKSLTGTPCHSCEFQQGCGGACAAQAYHETGSIDGPDTRCGRVARQTEGIEDPEQG